ncbi:MAG: Ig-like domain-containing protein, partial [Gammaproteobacteria bacterium]
MKIYNAGLTHTEYAHVSSAVITLNGVKILSPKELNQQVNYIEKTVTLQQLNKLSVEVRSKPGSALVINIAGIDNGLPVIIANVTPQANANDWHRRDVTVTFDCSDSLSGIASCTAPVTVTAEGAAQVVTGTAVDNAGNTADASIVINLDKTPPVVNIASPVAGSLTTQSNITVIGQTYDTLSFVTATINGIDLGLLMDGGFSYSTTLSEGLNTFTVVSVDRADNSTTRQFTVTYQPINNPPVTLPINVITQQDKPVEITLTASDEDADALNYLIVKQPEHGQLSGSGATLSYQPDVYYHGLDSFDYMANDGVDNSNIATVNIEVAKQLASIVLSPPADIIAEATAKLTPLDIGVATATDATGTSIDVVSDNNGPYPLGVTLVTWTATNKQGETASVQQKITVQDTTPPVVTLIGPDYITTYIESDIVYEFGATAYDLVDGDITESIIISDFDDPFVRYGYAYQYTATDASGNSASVIRVINLSFNFRYSVINTPRIVNYARGIVKIEAAGKLTSIEQPIVRDYLGNDVVVLKFSVFNGLDYDQITAIPDLLPVGNYEYRAHSVD